MARPHLLPSRLLAATVVGSVALSLGLIACGDGGSSTPPVELSEAGKAGRDLARASCANCHSVDGGNGTGPTWKDLAGSEVELEDGTTVIADDDYLTRSITDPQAQVVEGYGFMPSFGGLSDEDVADLVAYIRDLSTNTAPAPDPAEGGTDTPEGS